MMRLALLTTAVLILAMPVQAQDNNGMTPGIAECLQQNAAAVEAAEPDLTKATDYLVGSACAAPIAEVQQRLSAERMKQLAERNRTQCLDRAAQQKAQDADFPQPLHRVSENCQLAYDNLVASSPFPPIIGIGNRPAAAVSMAAKLILEHRLAHKKPRP
jgi:hypothetical protein